MGRFTRYDSTGSSTGSAEFFSIPRPWPAQVFSSPCTATMSPAVASSVVSYLAPEYRRSPVTFSPLIRLRFFRLPPVIFMQLRRFPCSSRMILYTFAPNCAGQSGWRAYFSINSMSLSTPSSLSPEPNSIGNTRRELIRAAISSSSIAPVSVYLSSRRSSHMARLSQSRDVCSPKSRQFSDRRRCASSITRSLSLPVRSIFVTKIIVGTRCLSRSRHRVSVCACTPSEPDMTSTA